MSNEYLKTHVVISSYLYLREEVRLLLNTKVGGLY